MINQTYTAALVVDDNRLCRMVSVAILQRLGFFVVNVANGREALAATAASKFSLILMDCEMPDLDGLSAALAIRQAEENHHSLIVALTSLDNREQCLAAGMDDHILKPLKADVLEEVLTRWGWKPVSSRSQLAAVRKALKQRREELEISKRKLALQHKALEQRKARSQFFEEQQRLSEWEQSLVCRDWALATRERFLLRREQIALQIDDNIFDAS